MYYSKQYRETIEYVRKTLEIDANYYPMLIAMGFAQLSADFAEEAITSWRRVVELAPWWSVGVGLLAATSYQAGDYKQSQEWAGKAAGAHGLGAAIYHAAVGEIDAMFNELDEAYRQRDRVLIEIRNLFFFDPYRADPRFQALLQRMNLA
jgi:tetratricopeptide (TPR) repeat protein